MNCLNKALIEITRIEDTMEFHYRCGALEGGTLNKFIKCEEYKVIEKDIKNVRDGLDK